LDEKSQIQALDRTQASLPMTKGRAGTMTHDYKRNGTTTLFAALDVLTGKVIEALHTYGGGDRFERASPSVIREVNVNVGREDVDTRRFYESQGFVNQEAGTDERMLCYI